MHIRLLYFGGLFRILAPTGHWLCLNPGKSHTCNFRSWPTLSCCPFCWAVCIKIQEYTISKDWEKAHSWSNHDSVQDTCVLLVCTDSWRHSCKRERQAWLTWECVFANKTQFMTYNKNILSVHITLETYRRWDRKHSPGVVYQRVPKENLHDSWESESWSLSLRDKTSSSSIFARL